MRRDRNESPAGGFTALELLIAAAITLVVAGGSVLIAPRIEAALLLDAAVRQVAADLRDARTLAIASAGSVRLVFTAGTSVYRRERQRSGGAYRVDRTRQLPRGIAVVDVNSGGVLTFSGRGNAENATITLIDRRHARRSLRLNQRGRVTILTAVT